MRAAVSLIGSRGRSGQAQRLSDQLLRGLALDIPQQLLRLGGAIAELEQPFAREHPRMLSLAAAHDDRGALGGARAAVDADLLAQLDDDPFGRALADPGDSLEAC